MNINIRVNEDKSCSPKDLVIGYVGEKNMDSIILQLDDKLPKMRYFLMLNDNIYPFINNELKIDERLTYKKGTLRVYVIGSNAKANEPITSGSMFFHSDVILMRVRGS